MITIASVLRSGGDYGLEYVDRLMAGVQRTLKLPHLRMCLTDIPKINFQNSPVDVIVPLEYGWPGWWAKMALFNLLGPVLYFDLDTVLVDSIDDLAEWVLKSSGEILMLRDFYRGVPSSGILGWNGDMRWILDSFVKDYANQSDWKYNPNNIWLFVGKKRFRGDQEWLREFIKQNQIRIALAQDVFPGIYSYKVNVQEKGSLPNDAKIVCFHGKPRPHEVCGDLDFQKFWAKPKSVLSPGGEM